MADKYIWHNTGAKELYNWAVCFGHTQANEDVIIESNTSEEYVCLCNVLGVSSLSIPVKLIRRDRWYIKGPITFTFPSTIAKLHIRRRQGEDIRETNIPSYNFTSSLDEYEACIAEFNFTSRLKKEGFCWQDGENITYPLLSTWNSHSQKSVARGITYPYNSVNINQNDEDQNILFPFRGIKQCLIPGYLTSDDSDEGATQGSINGAVYNTKALDPLLRPIGSLVSVDPVDKYSPGYSFGYDMQYNADNSDYRVTTKQDYNKMWNLCLYPLVLIDDSAGKRLNKKLIITTEGNQSYIQVFVGDTAITKKIPYDKNVDFLVAYKQDRVSCDAWMKVCDSGVPQADPAIPGQQVQCLWWDKQEGGCGKSNRVWVHANIFMYLNVTLSYDPANMYAFNWDSSSGEIYNSSSSLDTTKWLDIGSDSTPFKYRKYKDLFEVVSRNLSQGSGAPSSSPKWKRIADPNSHNKAFTKMNSTDTTSLTEYLIGSMDNVTDFTEYQRWPKTTCCDDNSCGDLSAYARVRAVVAGTTLSVQGKLKWSSDISNKYINYIKYWFGETNSIYWIGDDKKASYTPPVANKQPNIVGQLTSGKDGNTLTLSGGTIYYYIDNFYCPNIVNKTTKLEWYVPVQYVGEVGNDFSLRWTNVNIIPKTEGGGDVTNCAQESIVVLWVHELPDGNLAA